MAADANTLLSPAVLARTSGGSAGGAPAAQVPGIVSPALRAQQALSAANLARAAQDLANITAAQAAASASSQLTLGSAALSASSWNGTALSGLDPRDTDPTLWINADALQKDTANATATVKQTAANALLTWQSFDLNKGEKLIFDQQGHADWTVLNRIVAGPRDASGSRFVASPSTILGSIEAPGSVYVINPNGVVFGPTAQINVHSLIASSLDVGNPNMSIAERNSFFFNSGILGNGSAVPAESFSYNPADRVVEGDITVQAGAKITASLAPRAVSPDAGGFVYLFAPNVENAGTISTPSGETLMVAAQAVQLIANAYPDGFSGARSTFRAVGVNTTFTSSRIPDGPPITDIPIIWRTDGPLSAQISSPGRVTNSGLINAERGVVILNGDLVTNGASGGGLAVIQANTSITRNGQIFLNGRLQVNLRGGSLQILPAENGETIPDSASDKFAPGSITIQGQVVNIESGSLIEAPGANVSISAVSGQRGIGIYPESMFPAIRAQTLLRLYMASDSVIDVSGLQNVVRPMSDNFLTFKPFGNEFADQPLQRNGALRGQELRVDLRQSGTLNGVNWIGTPLANLAGYATSVPRTVEQLLTTGGKVQISSPGGQIVLRQGSTINVGGGSVRYEGAAISATRLLTADGRIVSIARADPLDTYVGIAGHFDELHPHWGSTTTQTFVNPLLSGGQFEPGYVEGHDAGAIQLQADAYVLDGNFHGGVIAGDRQRARGQRPTAGDGFLAMPKAGALSFNGISNLLLSADVAPLAGNFTLLTPLSSSLLQTTAVSAQKLSDAEFVSITANFSGRLEVGADANLTVAPGGTITLTGGSVDIQGSLVAHSGAITVDSSAHISGDTLNGSSTRYAPLDPLRPHIFDLVVGSAALLDVSGLWVNDNDAVPADLIGGAFIDGGSISLKTETRSAACSTSACKAGLGAGVPANVDLTGDIVLSQGALLEASSGGRITDRGVVMLDSKGRAAGKGGNISLATYVGGFSINGPPPPVTTTGLTAAIRLTGSDGSADANAAALVQALHAFGFAQGGTLTLQALSFDIGSAALPGGLALPAGFFDGNGFGAYSLTSIAGHNAVAPGAALVLRQRNLVVSSDLATLASGAKVSQIAAVDFLPDFIRQPVDLTLSSLLPLIAPGPYDPAAPVLSSAVALTVGDGASIQADPGAKISIGVTGRDAYAGRFGGGGEGFEPPIAAQTGVAEILGSIIAPGGDIALMGGENSRLWLGADSLLDVHGVVLTDSRQTLFRSGAVLPGGSVSIRAPTGSVIGLAGALIDVSGATGEFDLLADAQPTASGQQRLATTVWSDAGAIALSAPTLIYQGGFAAAGGASAGKGGSLVISSPDLKLTVRQDGNLIAAGAQSTGPLGALTGTAVLLAGRLANSGIEELTISTGLIAGDTIGAGGFAPGTLTFVDNVALSGLNELYLDASLIAWSGTAAPSDPRGCNVCLDAHYVALRGAGVSTKIIPKPGKGVFLASADLIDIAAGGSSSGGNPPNLLAISGIAKASFVSSGDIRLRVPLANVPPNLAPGTLPTGELFTAGDLSFAAAQVYPVSGVSFMLKSSSPTGTIAFAANGTPQPAPLSAGGQISVSAAHIDQNGVLLAPLGTIRLGAQSKADLAQNDPTNNTAIPTETLSFGAGSVTSVSLAGQIVPFGRTANQTSWSYNSFNGEPLKALPAKSLVLNAAQLALGKDATLDLRGGGDVQAIEFVPGTGGTRDVLAGSNVYAILPGYDPAAAPVDLDFLRQRLDTLPAIGSKVFLSGATGLPAGFYTLLPAHYATLPGAYRVASLGNSQDALSYLNQTLPDGTLRVAGYFANGATGARDARQRTFDVQSSNVWRQYSEIDQTLGSNFFAATEASAPLLPADAGRAALIGLDKIDLQGRILATPGANGRGGELDIVAHDIQVLAPGGVARSGYVGLDATQLSGLGIDSLLLGGLRSDSDDGQVITQVASSVEITNNADAPLEGPEIILVTRVGSDNNDPNGFRALRLDPNSVVRAKGPVVNPAQKKFVIGSDAAKIRGNGSLLAVSNGAGIVVERQHVLQNTGLITLMGPAFGSTARGASISGNSITIDTSGNIRPGSDVTITAANIFVAAKSINFGTTVSNAGLNVNGGITAQFQQATNLSLRSYRTIDFSGDVNFALGAGSRLALDSSALVSASGANTARLGADRMDFINSDNWDNPNAAGAAVLNLAASEINFGAGTKSFSGFGSVAVSASSLLSFRGTGSLDIGAANLSLQTPRLLVGANASHTVTTGGDLALTSLGSAASAPQGDVGGTFALTGRAITLGDNAEIQARAGGVTLTATAGDIRLGANAKIQANGFVAAFFDVSEVVGGGSVKLAANQGSIDLDPTARLDISSPAGQPGSAGQIILSAANGNIRSKGGAFEMAVIAGAVAGDGGGRLTINAQSLGNSAISVPGLFDAAIDLHLRQGDIQLGADLKTQSVSITADGGLLTIARTIDSAGEKGGSISLFGRDGVILDSGARLLATASDASKRGGEILIGTSASGLLDLRGGLIDLSNTANAANGGTLRLRAPLIGAAHDDVAITPVQTAIQGAASVTVEAYRVFSPSNSAFRGVIDPLALPGFFGACNSAGVCSGTLIDFVQDFALSSAAKSKFDAISSQTLHLQPGIELVNDDLTVNNGDITVARNWNLGSGVAGFLVSGQAFAPLGLPVVPAGTVMTDANGKLLPAYAGYRGTLIFVPGVSQIHSLFYRVGGSLLGEPGALTLRAARDVNINASITDGFFNTRNFADAAYQNALRNWLTTFTGPGSVTTDLSNVGGYLIAGATYPARAVGAPQAPYDAGANSISPTFAAARNKTPLASADLFPLIEDPAGPIQGAGKRYSAIQSWSYRIVSGADTASANPLAVRPVHLFESVGSLAGHGNVIIDGHTEFNILIFDSQSAGQNSARVIYETPTMVRTGTGSIDIAAGLDFILADIKAPGVVYTAGRNTVDLPDPGFTLQTVPDLRAPGETIQIPVATNPEGFLKPQIVTCDPFFGCNPYGPPTQAAYPVDGGHLSLTAQRDIIGYEHPTVASPGNGPGFPNQQYFAPWLLAQGTALPSKDFGPFAPLSGYLSFADAFFTPSQTSWWINFGSFAQGLMSVGGDITVRAGRDIQELSASLPTTARVSGGLSNTITDAQGKVSANIPVLHLIGSGDLTVIAGRDLKSGAYYEGSGHAKIMVGGSISASWLARESPTDPFVHPVSTILAVDTGTIALTARRDVDIGGIVSGPSLQNVGDPMGDVVLDLQSVSGYGPNSAVRLFSVGGDVVANSLTYDRALGANIAQINLFADRDVAAGIDRYPANFDAIAANGDVRIESPFRLAPSQDGTLNLLAHGSLLTSTSNFGNNGQSQPISTGPSLVEQVFNAVNPLAGFAPPPGSATSNLGILLLHQNDPTPDRFYAAGGDIIANASVASALLANPPAWEITKPAKVQAGRDIIDLSFFGQNLAASDVTSITAGRDISYTETWQTRLGSIDGIPDLGAVQNQGGLSLAGPGFFKVEAGRNLGPFVTAAGNIVASGKTGLPADPIGTGIVTFGNTITVGNRRMHNSENPLVADTFARGANNKLPRRGADIIALFGVANGVDYASVIKNYIDPTTSTSPRDYIPKLMTYLQTLGFGAQSRADAWATFTGLPSALQEVFVDKVFISEIKLPGDSQGCCYKDYATGYNMISTLFPAALGYTDNKVAAGETPARQATGDLDLLHATIKTLESASTSVVNEDGTTSAVQVGGDILVMGPGGSMNVGTTAPENNPRLSNSSLGLLTLDNGAISVFTDVSVLVNQSRILTVQGGDIMMWSSNGDLDAGRGAKTTVDFKALSVNFDPADLQTINLNGLVSGAGIGTIRSTPDAPSASTTLIAPRGTVNAGDAGLRSTGNLDILALLVLNAANIAVAGTVTGVPEANSVNLSALESASAAGGQAARIADDSVAAATNRGTQVARAAPSLITVEVLGFGDCDPEGGRGCPTQ
ncbi:MAG TPA: filamentous hemagglutinin family protein [Rhizomicrobium sp.]|nr:filamentous hemagglutinin family protein [Rhizomicrobium sp.]